MAIVYDKIGAEFFIRLDGPLDPLGRTYEVLNRPGMNGTALRELGKKANITELMGIRDVVSFDVATTTLVTYKGMLGTAATIRRGNSVVTNIIPIAVEEVDRYVVQTPSGGIVAGAFILVTRWQLLYGLAT